MQEGYSPVKQANLKQGLIDRALNIIANSVEMDFPQDTLRQTALQIASGIPVILVSNHQSHVDVMPLAVIANQVRRAANDYISTGKYPRKKAFSHFLCPMASSVVTGGQTQDITAGYINTRDWLLKNGIVTVPVTRDRDIKYYGGQGLPPTIDSMRALLTAFKDGHGLAITIAGTVEEGRRKKGGRSGKRIGLKKLSSKNLLTETVVRQHAAGINTLIVPIAISGTYLLFDPDERKVTLSSVRTLVRNLVPFSLTKATTVKVAQPIMTEELWADAPEDEADLHTFLNNRLLVIIASKLPPEARGEFANMV